MTNAHSPASPPLPSAETWRARVERDLRGASFERKLVKTLLGGVTVQPLYTADDAPGSVGQPGSAPFVRGATAVPGWSVGAVVLEPDPRELGGRLAELRALSGTVARVRLCAAGRWGTLLGNRQILLEALSSAPEGLTLDLVGADCTLDDWSALAAAVPNARLGIDPLSARAVQGGGSTGVSCQAAAPLVLAGTASRARISTVPVSDAGGSGVLELAWALSCGVAWLRALRGAGASVEEASRRIQLDLALGTELFSEVARVRAARLLWARLTEACGQACGLSVHAVQGRRAMTRRDVWGNLLRGVTAATAGVLGGAQTVSLWPMDARAGVPGSLGRRLAVTTQLLLRDESHLDTVLDPLGGSWAVERLTHDTAERAWTLFQEIERQGGAEAVLTSGWLRAQADADHGARQARIRARRDTVVGVSDFAVAHQTQPDTRSVDRSALRAALGLDPLGPPGSSSRTGSSSRAGSSHTTAAPLPFRPDAAPFEALRDGAEALSLDSGVPTVHLCALGPLKERAARTAWVENALTAGGLAVETVTPDATLAGGVVVLCGSDARYQDLSALVALLRAEDCTLVLAGRPEALPDGIAVDHHLHAGADLVSVLDAIQTALAGGAA